VHFEALVTIITQFKEGIFLCLVSENTCVYTFPALPSLRKITRNPERGEVSEAQFPKETAGFSCRAWFLESFLSL